MIKHDKQYLCPVTLETIKKGKGQNMSITRLDVYGTDFSTIDYGWTRSYQRIINSDIDAIRTNVYLDDVTLTVVTPYDDECIDRNVFETEQKVVAYILLDVININDITNADKLKDIDNILDSAETYIKNLPRTNVSKLKDLLTTYIE